MAEAPSETAVSAGHKGGISAIDKLAATKDLQRLIRETGRVPVTIPFRPSDSMLYPDPNHWKPQTSHDSGAEAAII